MKIIGIVGFAGSGKGTVGDYLVRQYKFEETSYAKTLKDVVSAIFCWPRHMIEGDTKESRAWREEVDPWWSKKLGRPVTPRWALQYVGTDTLRMHFNTNIWVWSVEKQILNLNTDVVITDARFPNEVNLIKEMGGKIVWVQKGPLPEWYDAALEQNRNQGYRMTKLYPHVHSSEWAWIGTPYDAVIHNDGTIKDLYKAADKCLQTLN